MPKSKLDSKKEKAYLNRDFDHNCGIPCCARDLNGNDVDYVDLIGGCHGFLIGLCCAPCVVGRAFENLHPLQEIGPECGNVCPRTCLGCGLCLMDGMMPWAIAYIGSHSRDKSNPASVNETCLMCCAGSFCAICCCAPCQIAGELRKEHQKATGPLENLL